MIFGCLMILMKIIVIKRINRKRKIKFEMEIKNLRKIIK